MGSRAQQREETRERIVEAAVAAFADLGYRGASTREIAARAGANQGLITYHFRSKEALWRAAADRIFGQLRSHLGERLAGLDAADPRERAREGVREYVRFAAAHPELFRFLVEQGKSDDLQTEWLVEHHLKPIYENLPAGVPGLDGGLKPHAFYAMAGAASVLFAVAPEARALTGIDATAPEVVETHADFVARLLVP